MLPIILYEDNDILVVNKPAGYLTIPDRFNAEEPSLLGFLEQRYPEIFVVHRLDRETSGILVFAKNAEAHRNLSMQFEKRKTAKSYLALLEGDLKDETGEINVNIGENHAKPGTMRVTRDGKPSLTRWEVLEHFKHFTLVKATIHTGRMHQIRVHFAWKGFPLAADSLYGTRKELFLSDIKTKKFKLSKLVDEERPLLPRCALHSFSLGFTHPTTNEPAYFECPPPKDFQATVTQLGKWGK